MSFTENFVLASQLPACPPNCPLLGLFLGFRFLFLKCFNNVLHDLAADNITVNSIGPGLFESEMTENTLFRHEAFMQMYDTLTPASRPGAKGELNGTILYFSSQASSYVTGQHIIVDGGFSIV